MNPGADIEYALIPLDSREPKWFHGPMVGAMAIAEVREERAWVVAARLHDVDAIGPVKRSALRSKPVIFWCLALIFLENLRQSKPNRRHCLPPGRRSLIQ